MLGIIEELAKCGHRVTLVSTPNAEIVRQADKEVINVVPMRIAGDLDPLSIIELIKIYRKRKIDIVFANVGKDIRLSGIAAKFVPGVSVIALHQVDREIKNNFRYKITYNSLADVIVVNSLATKNTLLQSAPWLMDEKIKVVYHGINSEKYSMANTLSSPFFMGNSPS